jgi:hypothetical protein
MTPDVGVPESNQSDIDQRDEKEGKRISMPNIWLQRTYRNVTHSARMKSRMRAISVRRRTKRYAPAGASRSGVAGR